MGDGGTMVVGQWALDSGLYVCTFTFVLSTTIC